MYFTPHLFALDEAGQKTTLAAPKIWGQGVCLVPRSECSFRRIKITGRGKKPLQAGYLRVQKEALPHENKFLIVADEHGRRASVWGYKSVAGSNGRYYPESLAVESMNSGVRLVKNMSGYEGQVWADSNLVASRWWPTPPDGQQWQSFIYGAQAETDIAFMPLPQSEQIPFRTDLPRFKLEQDRATELFSPRNLALAAALFFGCATLFIGGQYSRNALMLNSVQNQIEDVSLITGQISSERRRAIANMTYAQRFESLGHSGTFLLALDGLAQVLNNQELLIERISYQSGELEVRLRYVEEVSVADMVTELEALPSVSEVNVALDALNTVVVRANVSAPSELEATAVAAGGL